MTQETLTLLLLIGKYIIASALMVIFYVILFREKASINHCRIYLISIAIIALLLSQFNIVVYTPQVQTIEMESLKSSPEIFKNATLSTPKEIMQSLSVQQKANEKTFLPKEILEFLTIKNILLTIYISVTFVLFILLFIQFFKIIALKRRGKITIKDSFEMVESTEILTPFSFYKTIFLHPNLKGSKLQMILRHEQWHITHRHYLDAFAVEIIVRLLWFNPVLWWIRKEIRSISEFQADRSVLNEGQDLYTYQTVILEEVMEYNPYLANGFNNSFTKKRFIMMKNKCQIRYATLRRALILPFFICIFSLLCFTTGKSEVKYKVINTEENATLILNDSSVTGVDSTSVINVDSTLVEDSTSSVYSGVKNNTKFEFSTKNTKNEVDKAINEFSEQINSIVILMSGINSNRKKTLSNTDISRIMRLTKIFLAGKEISKLNFTEEFLTTLTNEDLRNFNLHCLKMRDEIIKIKKEKSTRVKSQSLANLVIQMMQDDLISKIMEESMDMIPPNIPENTTNTVSKHTTATFIPSNPMIIPQNERQALDDKLWKEAYRLKSDQYNVSEIPYDPSGEKLVRIEKYKNETKVTYAIPVDNDQWWIYFSDGLTIVDKKTKDRYIVRSVEKELPFNQTLIVTGCGRKMIEITEVFPPLKKSVDTIDILTLTSNFQNIMSNRGPNTTFRDVKIADYLHGNSGKVYR